MPSVFIEKRRVEGFQGEIAERLRDHFPLFMSASFLLLIIGITLLSYLSPYNGLDLRPEEQLRPPSINHPFGTDPDGRDLFIRVLIGTRAYLLPGILAVGIAILLGTILGMMASGIWKGVLGRGLGFFAQCLMDVLESFPKYITLLLAITIIPEPNFYHMMGILGLLNSSKIGKLVMEKIRSLKEREFIEATEALGIKKLDIVLRHILFYNCFPIFLIQASLQMAEAILIEIGLSYLGAISNWGLGVTVQEPMPSWGNILVIAKDHFADGWWITLFPLVVVILNILTFYLFSDSLSRVFAGRRVSEEL